MSSSLQELSNAIQEHDESTVRSMLSSGLIDVNARMPGHHHNSSHVFQFAANYMSFVILEFLLNAGADINGRDLKGRTACHDAAAQRNIERLRFLHAHGADIGIADLNGHTPLDVVLRGISIHSMRPIVVALVELGAPLDFDNTMLYAVAAMGTTCIQALLDRGIAVNELRSENGATPLHFVDHMDELSDTVPVDIDGRPHLHFFSEPVDEPVSFTLVNTCGIDINARDSRGLTSCHEAASLHIVRKLRWLIEAGADIEIVDNDGRTPLHFVMSDSIFPRLHCVTLLLAAGANVYAQDNNGVTPCHIAAFLEHEANAVSLVETLLASGANDILDEKNHNGITPRHVLAYRKHTVGNDEAIQAARRRIAARRLDFVRKRALQVCIGLEPLKLDALQTCEILVHACGPIATLVPFHQWWKIAMTVKHFEKRNV
jgi:ankyrin repeat protein